MPFGHDARVLQFPAARATSRAGVQQVTRDEARLRRAVTALFVRLLAGERSDDLLRLAREARARARKLEEALIGHPSRESNQRMLDLAAFARDLDVIARDLVRKSP
jgi:hypothetical protein